MLEQLKDIICEYVEVEKKDISEGFQDLWKTWGSTPMISWRW